VLSREQFESYTSPLITNNPDILSIAWVPRVLKHELDDYINKANYEGYFEFDIHQLNDFQEHKYFQDTFPVYYLNSFNQSSKLLGLDVNSSRILSPLLEQSSKNNTTRFSNPMNLFDKSTQAVIALTPVYSKRFNQHAPESNVINLSGFILIMIELNDFFDFAINLPFDNEKIWTSLKDFESDEVLVSNALTTDVATDDYSINYVIDTGNKLDISVRQMGTMWKLIISAANDFHYDVFYHSYLISLLGAFISLILGLFINNKVISDKQIKLYASVFKYSNNAILISDENNKIIATNPALTSISGYSQDELIGKN